ncbi:hypothetical protein D3C77_343240 [compost metagenome]
MRFTNKITAKIKPTSTAVVSVVNTVSRNVTNKIIVSPLFVLNNAPKDLRSLIFHATIIRIGAILASGILDAYGANMTTISNTTTP